MTFADVLARARKVSSEFSAARRERQVRRALEAPDFERLRETGFLDVGRSLENGGLFESARTSVRPIAEILRVLAQGDSSVALVAAMHPAVLSYWLAPRERPASFDAQGRAIDADVKAGAWWSTITSEPGSGGDIARTKTIARRAAGGRWTLHGVKHFGSGSGIASFMVTTAVPEGEADPELFFIDLRGVPADGSRGLTMLAPWDGHGMTATQSHAMRFDGLAAERSAWPGGLPAILEAAGGFIGCCFAAVAVGIVDIAITTARHDLAKRSDSLRPYEQVEWTRAENEGWLLVQAYEGMLRAVEAAGGTPRAVYQGKLAIAELAESSLRRLCNVLGGGTYARQSPFGFWFEDVRALGFLRPPWGLAYDRVFGGSLETL